MSGYPPLLACRPSNPASRRRPLPLLTTPDDILAHLRHVLTTRHRWVFLTDHRDGFVILLGALMGLRLRGLPEEAMRFGSCEYMHVPAGARATLAFLTVTKSRLRAADVNRLLESAGFDQRVADGGQDLVALGGYPTSGQTILAFLSAVKSGTCHTTDPAAN